MFEERYGCVNEVTVFERKCIACLERCNVL